MEQDNFASGHHLAEVTKDYSAAYTDPLIVKAGEQLAVGQQDTEYPGWIWCSNDAGKSGWVPESYLRIVAVANDAVGGQIENRLATMRGDYDATELTVKTGERLTVLQEESGWARCKSTDGQIGWVPLSHLKMIS